MLAALLRFPSDSPEPGRPLLEAPRWLALAARLVSRFRPHPAVLRHSQNPSSGMRASVEVRRWTGEPYCRLRDSLLLDERGNLFEIVLESRRLLRNTPNERLLDEIYTLRPLREVGPAHFQAVLGAVLSQHVAQAYPSWARLSRLERQRLTSYPAGWEQAQAALDCSGGEEVVETLNCLLSSEADAELKANLLEAAEQGLMRSSPQVLPWLLAWPDWNQHPGLVGLARRAAQDDPARAWEIRQHPNRQVRARLASLLEGELDWVGWLAQEADPTVRDNLRRSIEKYCNPSQLVQRMSEEPERARREALGWLLVNWSRRIDCSQDWGALNQALRRGLIPEHRQKLKKKLASAGQLSFRSRWLS